MKASFDRLMRILSGRVARNIYFWIWMVYMRLEYQYTSLKVALTAWLFALLALLFYGNNLGLIPRFFAKKKYVKYLLSYTALTFVVAVLYTGTLKGIAHYYPD